MEKEKLHSISSLRWLFKRQFSKFDCQLSSYAIRLSTSSYNWEKDSLKIVPKLKISYDLNSQKTCLLSYERAILYCDKDQNVAQYRFRSHIQSTVDLRALGYGEHHMKFKRTHAISLMVVLPNLFIETYIIYKLIWYTKNETMCLTMGSENRIVR